MPDRKDVIETPMHQRMLDFRQRQLPALVWVVCAAICAWMLFDRAHQTEYIALAQSMQYEISSPAVGQIEALFVEPYESVDAGDIVAKLDASEIEARIERSHAAIRMLRAELVSARSGLQADNEQGRASWTSDLRRFQTDEEERRLAILELRATIEADEIELDRQNIRIERADPLKTAGILGPLQYEELRLDRDEVSQRLQESLSLLNQAEEEYQIARSRRADFESALPRLPNEEPFLSPLREAISVESQRLREIEVRREGLILRSPIRGQVSRILCRPGQSIVPGEPILTITDSSVRDIVAFLAESDPRPIRENAPVLVSSLDRPGKLTESFVVRVGTGVDVMPRRLWRDPGVPTYGRAVVIAALPDMNLRPGELLNVHFLAD